MAASDHLCHRAKIHISAGQALFWQTLHRDGRGLRVSHVSDLIVEWVHLAAKSALSRGMSGRPPHASSREGRRTGVRTSLLDPGQERQAQLKAGGPAGAGSGRSSVAG